MLRDLTVAFVNNLASKSYINFISIFALHITVNCNLVKKFTLYPTVVLDGLLDKQQEPLKSVVPFFLLLNVFIFIENKQR